MRHLAMFWGWGANLKYCEDWRCKNEVIALEHPREACGNNNEDTKGEFNFLGEGTLAETEINNKESPKIFVCACAFMCVQIESRFLNLSGNIRI